MVLGRFDADNYSPVPQSLAWLDSNCVCWPTNVRYFYFKVIDLKKEKVQKEKL